jgi:predicted permease
MTLILLNALLRIFVGLILGYIAGRRGVMDNLNVQNLIVLVMDFAIPCALFYTISRTSWPVLVEQSEPAVMIGVVFVTLYAAS